MYICSAYIYIYCNMFKFVQYIYIYIHIYKHNSHMNCIIIWCLATCSHQSPHLRASAVQPKGAIILEPGANQHLQREVNQEPQSIPSCPIETS